MLFVFDRQQTTPHDGLLIRILRFLTCWSEFKCDGEDASAITAWDRTRSMFDVFSMPMSPVLHAKSHLLCNVLWPEILMVIYRNFHVAFTVFFPAFDQ